MGKRQTIGDEYSFFEVECADCHATRLYYATLSTGAKVIQDLGWFYTNEGTWLCPDCVEKSLEVNEVG